MKIKVNTDTLNPHSEDNELGWVLVTVLDRDNGIVDVDATPFERPSKEPKP